MKNPIVIIAALEREISAQVLPVHIPIVYSGIGKINATMATIRAVQQYQPKLIINLGTAGGVNSNLSGLVQVRKVVQRDMIAEPLAPRGSVPFANKPNVFHAVRGDYVCGTGDSFVTQKDEWLIENQIHLVDMELFAIASVAYEYGVNWMAYKYISDNANDFSGEEWDNSVNHGEALFLEKLEELLSVNSLPK